MKKIWLMMGVLICIAGNIHAGIKGVEYCGLKGVEIENEALKLIVLPQRGANIASIVYKSSGREWMWHNPKPYVIPAYADSYGKYDLSGFDDCFPTVGKCPYPDGAWKGITIPDHGEVWAMPWEYETYNGNAKFWVFGMRFPYFLQKTISLSGNKINISYKIKNLAIERLKVIWAGHSLVAVSNGMEMLFPKGTIIKGDTSPWPPTEKGKFLSMTVGDSSARIARKLFTEKVPEGWCGFFEPNSKDFLIYSYPKDKISYIGIYINQGAGLGHYNVGLEPTNCGAETVEIGDREGILIPIPAKGTLEWNLIITLGKAKNIDEIPVK